MKTKLIAPWKLKVGQRLVQHEIDLTSKSFEIKEITKEIGRFTGRTIWRVKTDNFLLPISQFHGKGISLPHTKAEIEIK